LAKGIAFHTQVLASSANPLTTPYRVCTTSFPVQVDTAGVDPSVSVAMVVGLGVAVSLGTAVGVDTAVDMAVGLAVAVGARVFSFPLPQAANIGTIKTKARARAINLYQKLPFGNMVNHLLLRHR
jgi:hypothetical protein